MIDVLNGTDLGLQYNWDNDPCRRIVDQKYRVLIKEKYHEDSILDSLKQRIERLRVLGFTPKLELSLCMAHEYTSPLKCLEVVNQLEQSGFEVEINERRFIATGQPYWDKLPKVELKRILGGEREPNCRLVVPSNPNFSSCVDIGD